MALVSLCLIWIDRKWPLFRVNTKAYGKKEWERTSQVYLFFIWKLFALGCDKTCMQFNYRRLMSLLPHSPSFEPLVVPHTPASLSPFVSFILKFFLCLSNQYLVLCSLIPLLFFWPPTSLLLSLLYKSQLTPGLNWEQSLISCESVCCVN